MHFPPTLIPSFFSLLRHNLDIVLIVSFFTSLYIFLACIVSGEHAWWVIDYVSGKNIFYGDDAYRFFLARSAWLDPALYAYNFNLPVSMVLDSIVVNLAGEDLLLSRCIHAFLGSCALVLVWRSGLLLGLRKSVMVCAILIMGMMPLYALVSISFYGESWLGLGLCMILWLFLRNRLVAASLVTGLLPLIRPEGIFFLVPLLVFMVKERKWYASSLMIMPGLFYFLFLLFWLPEFQDFMQWRIEVRRVLSKLMYSNDLSLLPSTYSLMLVLPAALGIFFKPLRSLWPFMAGGFLWLCFLQLGISLRQSSYEPRYTYILIPVLILMWASFFSWIYEKSEDYSWWQNKRKAVMAGVSVVLLFLQFDKVNAINLVLREKGVLWSVETVMRGGWKDIFPAYFPGFINDYKLIAEKIHELTSSDAGIDRLIMFDYFLYYFVDPKKLPARVRVDYPSVSYMVSHFDLNGLVLTQHPRGNMYSYIRFSEPGFQPGERRALYADLMPMPRYPYRWQSGPAELYLFSYKESAVPDIDLDSLHQINPDEVLQRYKRVFGW